MCRNIKTLFNFEPPATEEEVQASALQYVRKVSGSDRPSAANRVAFDTAVREIARATSKLLASLSTTTPPRSRATEAARAHARAVRRFGPAAR